MPRYHSIHDDVEVATKWWSDYPTQKYTDMARAQKTFSNLIGDVWSKPKRLKSTSVSSLAPSLALPQYYRQAERIVHTERVYKPFMYDWYNKAYSQHRYIDTQREIMRPLKRDPAPLRYKPLKAAPLRSYLHGSQQYLDRYVSNRLKSDDFGQRFAYSAYEWRKPQDHSFNRNFILFIVNLSLYLLTKNKLGDLVLLNRYNIINQSDARILQTVIDPENSQKLPYKQQQQQSFYQSNGQQHPYQQSKTSNTYPGSERSSGIYKGNGSSSANTTTTATDFPANFPKIPPPKGVIDNKQLERMAEQLMKGQQPTWDGQQYSPPGWTRHSQQSYTIETVVEHEPETRPIYVGKHYESVPPKTGILPQTHPKHQYSPSQQIPTKTTKQPPPPPSSQIYRQPQFQEKYNYQPPEQQYYNKTVQQKQQIPPVEPQKQFPPQQQQQKYFPPQQIPQQQKPSATIIEERQEKKSTSVVDSTNFPSQQYTKTLTEYMKQTNGYDSQKKEGGGGGAQQQPAEQWGQSQQHWKQTPQQAKENEGQQSQQWQQTQKYATQQQQNLLKQETQQQQTQQYSPQKAQNELKQQTTETNIQAQQSQKQSGTSKVEQKEREQKIEQDVGDEYDGPPPDLQLAQADPDKLYEKQHEVYQNGWQQEEDYHQQPYRSHHLNQRQLQQTRNNYDEPLYISAGGDDGYQQQYHQYYSPNSQIYWDSVYNDEWALRGANPPSFTTGPVWGDHLPYAQRMNLEKRRTESEKQRRHHTPVPGSAEYGYLFGGMDFVDHNNFDPSINVGEPFNEMQERHSRRDLHWGPPRRRGDFFGLDYRTMLPEEEQHRSHSAEDSAFYQGYQALPPRKNFRLVGHFTADHNAPLNIAEAQGLDEFDSQYWVGDTLSNQKVRPEYPLTEEEKRTFALLYGPGGFKPDHRTVIPEPKPEEPVQFSVTIGPKKEKKEQQQAEGYVNPMKVEGESWMLGQRGEYDGQYGKILHSTAEQHLPFHRPKHFPARVPNWAVERQNQMGRGARSLDRSLFLPSWAKIPQPQPPFWVIKN
uniref:Uncharacterized protein n=1 Tax=Meloidogyne javanica TaxID=6303 RepID=A0A915MWZ1_MELJA